MRMDSKTITMKKIVISFFSLYLFFHFEISAQKNNSVFFYQVEYAIDSTNLENRKNELMVLWTTPTQSLFQSYNGYLRDSVYNYYLGVAKNNDKIGKKSGSTNINQMMQDLSRFPNPGFSYKILKSKNEGLVYNYRKIFKTDYVYVEPLQAKNWRIGEGEKEVLSYKCQIATIEYGGRKFVAWFTTDIPNNDGPYTFNGLPGLIVEIYDSEYHYHFKLVGVENGNSKIAEQIPKKPLKVEKVKYFKMEDEYRQNPLSQMSDADASRLSPSDANAVHERLKSQNNRLELVIEK
jgi:GLPGLI family protein